MAGQDSQQYDFSDPYYRVTPLANTQFVQTSRQIVLTQGSAGMDLVVDAARDQDVVVYADEVTIKGEVTVQRPPAQTEVDGVPTVNDGGHVVILARKLDTQTGDSGGTTTDAMLILKGAPGWTSSDATWTAPPHNGVGDTGTSGTPDVWSNGDEEPGTPGGTGQSSLDASGKFDPMCPLNGKDGANGGAGGAGGSFELRCYSLESTVALGVDVGGGTGGDGENGQPGAKGGAGGPGGKINWRDGMVESPTAGGDGGRGGNGGNGGIPGAGGAPGSISISVVNASADAVADAITCKLDAGAWGTPGKGGKAGAGGDAGAGEPNDKSAPNGQQGVGGTDGGTPDASQFKQADPAKATITTSCDGNALVDKLTLPLSPYLGMMLDMMRAAYLEATGDPSTDALHDLTDQLTWVAMLATAYTPIDQTEQTAMDAVLARTQFMQEHVKRGHDYFGRTSTFAPLGSLDFYRGQFGTDLDTLRQVWADYQSNLSALDHATATKIQIDAAVAKLKENQALYTGDPESPQSARPSLIDAERATIQQLADRVNGHDADTVNAQQTLVKAATDEFKQQIQDACGLTLEDLMTVIGQFAFFGEKQFQQAAMVVSQTASLINTATSKCLADDGTQVDKQWVIGQLTAVDDLQQSLQGYSGTINGIALSDPGALKLLGVQSQLDDLCNKFWSDSGARATKTAFDDYVSAVQARNADILTLNEALARLRGYLADAAQTAASLAEAEDANSALSAPGAPSLVTQLARMVTRATDDCIRDLYHMSRAYWMWTLQPGDELAKQLKDIGANDPLAITPDVLMSAATGLASDYGDVFTAQLENAGEWFPPPDHQGVWWPSPKARGIRVTFTHDSHPDFIEAFRKNWTATIGIAAPRADTQAVDSPFAGYADVRITKVRPWVFGAKLGASPVKQTIRVDLTHTGCETIMSPDDTVTVVNHDPVDLSFEYAPDRLDDPGGIAMDGTLFDTVNPSPASMIGPFTRWRIAISKTYNDASLDISGIDKVEFEFFGHQRPYPVTSLETRAEPAAVAAGA